jgi:hypothetical protein
MITRVGTMVLLALALVGLFDRASAEAVIEIATRPAVRVRALLDKPERPIGSVILLAGGNGNLGLGTNGQIGWLKGNQLVRSRDKYAEAGFATLVPDLAPDLKQGADVRPRYRWSEPHARDIGAMVTYLRAIAEPVVLVGTSRAALSVVNAAVRLTGKARPDALVITSGMLMQVDGFQPSVERMIGRLDRVTQPMLLVAHKDDDCTFTPASSVGAFKMLPTRTRVDSIVLRGGPEGWGDPCGAYAHHGFFGQDDEVVAAITRWIGLLR